MGSESRSAVKQKWRVSKVNEDIIPAAQVSHGNVFNILMF